MTPDLLRLAVDVAREAGALVADLRAIGPVPVAATKTSPTDVVTASDTAAESLIRERISRARPDDGFLGEEDGGVRGSSGVTWVVDPIDGTVNYLYAIPAYAVSIAAEVDGEVVAGVVHNPAAGETFTAVRGGGAELDGAPIGVGSEHRLEHALVATGFAYDPVRRARQAQAVAQLLTRVRDIRRFGAASLDLCAVAAGRVDAYVEQGLRRWDLAAGGLIAAEAGARVAQLDADSAEARPVLAANPALFSTLEPVVAEHFR